MDVYNLSVGLKKAYIKVRHKNVRTVIVPEKFTITAHTGAMYTVHNSLWSARECILSGADIIEVDVTLRCDGTFVLIHKDSAGDGEGVPIGDFLNLLDGNSVRVNLDLKAFENLGALQNIIKERGLLDRVFFTGVSEKEIEKVRSTASEIPSYLNAFADDDKLHDRTYAEEFARKVKDCGAIGLNTNYRRLSKEITDAVHALGLYVSAWTVNDAGNMRKIIAMGADNITTKKPLLLCKTAGRNG